MEDSPTKLRTPAITVSLDYDQPKTEIPPGETLVEYFSCALFRGTFYRYGWMYITNNLVYFESPLLDSRIVIQFRNIKSMKKKYGKWMKTDAIEIIHSENDLNQRYYFSGFLNRDKTFANLEQLWKVAMTHLLKIADTDSNYGKTGEFTGIEQALPTNKLHELIAKEQKLRSSSENSEDSEDNSDFVSKRSSSSNYWFQDLMGDFLGPLEASPTKYIIRDQKRHDFIYEKFRIPSDEKIVYDHRVGYWYSGVYENGWLFFTKNFMLFGNRKLKFVIPLKSFIDVSKQNVLGIGESGIEFVTSSQQIFFFRMSTPQTETLFKQISELKSLVSASSKKKNVVKQVVDLYSELKSPSTPNVSFPLDNISLRRDRLKLGGEILSDKSNFSPNYLKKQVKSEEIHSEYLKKNIIGEFGLIQTGELHRIVRKGIPDCYRSHIWKVCSGAYYKALTSDKTYEQLLEESKGKESVYTDMIYRDLHRSLPEHTYYQKQKGLNALNRVLTTYAYRNPIIGYCQAMNYIVAALLLILKESDAFWVLCSICEDIVPTYFRPQMLGTLLEQKIFEFLLEHYMPDIAKHFKDCHVPISVITTQWFLCLFIGHVPLEVAYRVLDCWFCINTDALFQVGLAMMKMRRAELLKTSRVDQISAVFKDHAYDACELLKIAWSKEFLYLPRERMNEIKNESQFVLIKGIHQTVKAKKIQKLVNKTSFSKTELMFIIDKWHQSLPTNSFGKMEFTIFLGVVPQYFPFWSQFLEDGLPSKLYGCLVTDEGEPLMRIDDFIMGLDLVYKKPLEDKWNLCKRMYGVNDTGTTPKRQFTPAITVFTKLFIDDQKSLKKEIELFVEEVSEMSKVSEGLEISVVVMEKVPPIDQIMKRFELDENLIHQYFQVVFNINNTKQ